MKKKISELLAESKQGQPAQVAVAAAHDNEVLRAVSMAHKEGIAQFTLIGHREKIEQMITAMGEKPAQYRIEDGEDEQQCARRAVELVREKKAEVLMKGVIPTSTLLRAVLDKENGLATGRRMSHVMMLETAAYNKPLFLTDGGMNTYPDLAAKADILENAAQVLKALEYETIYAACICGAEEVNSKIQATVDARALSEMTERWKPYNMIVNGPMALDLAVSRSACEHKRYESEVGGRADLLLVPTYEVGNVIIKSMTYFAQARSAGIIVGAAAPIVLVSRADPAEAKLAALALARAVSRAKK